MSIKRNLNCQRHVELTKKIFMYFTQDPSSDTAKVWLITVSICWKFEALFNGNKIFYYYMDYGEEN